MKEWSVIYQYCDDHPNCDDHGYYRVASKSLLGVLKSSYTVSLRQIAGFALLAIGLGGVLGPMVPTIRLEAGYALTQLIGNKKQTAVRSMPKSAPVVFEPLTTPDGASIAPVDEEFGLVVPKIGINASIIPGVNPMQPDEYKEALKSGIAHASTSFYPNEDGTVYLFSHSTNYDWFVSDLNAVFYLLKDLEKGDLAVIFYHGKRYTYKITEKRVVSPRSISFLVPYVGHRNLILQTCWPPGSTTQRLLLLADLVEEDGKAI